MSAPRNSDPSRCTHTVGLAEVDATASFVEVVVTMEEDGAEILTEVDTRVKVDAEASTADEAAMGVDEGDETAAAGRKISFLAPWRVKDHLPPEP